MGLYNRAILRYDIKESFCKKKEGTALYTENDFQEISAQLKKRMIVLVIPALLLLAAVIVSFVFRNQLFTTVFSLLLGFYGIFSFSMFIYPVLAYKRHLHYVLHGRVRKLTGAF